MGKLWTTLTFFTFASAALFESTFWGVTLLYWLFKSFFFFQPCISLESALIEALDKFTASETLKIMQVITFKCMLYETRVATIKEISQRQNQAQFTHRNMQEGRVGGTSSTKETVKSQCPHWKYVTEPFILVVLPINEHRTFVSAVVGKVVCNLQ